MMKNQSSRRRRIGICLGSRTCNVVSTRNGTDNHMKTKMVLAILVMASVFAVAACGNHGSSGDSVSAAGAAPSAGSASGGGAPAPTDFGPMRTVNIFDPMFNNMVAFVLSIPKSWNFEGTVLHGPGCDGEQSVLVFRAYSSDMLYGVQAIPTSPFFWADDKRALPESPACKILQPMSAGDYGKLIAIRLRPGSVVDSVESEPDDAAYQATVEEHNRSLAAQAASFGSRNPAKEKGEMKRIHIHYNLNGHPEEEWLVVSMSVTNSLVSVNVSPPGKLMQLAMKQFYRSFPIVSGARTPQGQLQAHEAAIKAMSDSLKANPDYMAKYTAYMQDATNKAIAASWAVTNSILAQGRADQAQRTQNAQAFIQNMQKQGDARNAQFAANQAQKGANVADFNAHEAQRSAHAADVS